MNQDRDIIWTTKFKKDYKTAIKRNIDIGLIDECIRLLAAREQLAPKYRDHALTGKWAGNRECHILPDWLLIYRIEGDDLILVLARTGSHSDLF